MQSVVTMTELLERAIARLQALPESEQDAIASMILEEIADDLNGDVAPTDWVSHQQDFQGQPAIIRTERGLSISGTRITIYDVMDYLKADYPPKLIREKLCLNTAQINSALAYIETNKADVEAEYQDCLKTAAEIRQYWEEKNHERFAQIAATPHKADQEAIRAKLKAWKERLDAEHELSN